MVNNVSIQGRLVWEPYYERDRYITDLHSDEGFFHIDLTAIKNDFDFDTYVENKLSVKIVGQLKTDPFSNAYIEVSDMQFMPQ